MNELRRFDDVIGARPSWLPLPTLGDATLPASTQAPAIGVAAVQHVPAISGAPFVLADKVLGLATPRALERFKEHEAKLWRLIYDFERFDPWRVERRERRAWTNELVPDLSRAVAAALFPAPAAFSVEWFNAFWSFLREMDAEPAASTALRAWQQIWSHGTVREPHIEVFGDEIRFTWRRDGHYLEFGTFADGHLEWFYRSPAKETQGGEGASLDDSFFALLRFARP